MARTNPHGVDVDRVSKGTVFKHETLGTCRVNEIVTFSHNGENVKIYRMTQLQRPVAASGDRIEPFLAGITRLVEKNARGRREYIELSDDELNF